MGESLPEMESHAASYEEQTRELLLIAPGLYRSRVPLAFRFVSVENAMLNLREETKDLDFDMVREKTLKNWENHLSKIKIELEETLRHREESEKQMDNITTHREYELLDKQINEDRIKEEKGIKYGDISITSRQLMDYEFILESAMERYDIPYFIDTERSVMHTSVVLLITSLLELCSADKPDSEAIFRYAKTGLTDVKLYEISILENYCYKWGVKGDMWNEKFEASDSEEDEKAEEIREKLVVPVLELKRKCSGQDIRTVCMYIYDFLEKNQIIESVKYLIVSYKELGFTDMSSQLNRLWNAITDAFDVMVEMLGNEKISLAVFRELFVLNRTNFSVRLRNWI